MNIRLIESLNKNYLYTTDRISVLNWNHLESEEEWNKSINSVLKIMTSKVTATLPVGWQELNTAEKAKDWIIDRQLECNIFAIMLTENTETIGFMFLYHDEEGTEAVELRLGYLLAQSFWGRGIGSALIKGLVEWSKNTGAISSISGRVDKENIGSIKVLEKNGFYNSEEELPGGMLLFKIKFDI